MLKIKYQIDTNCYRKISIHVKIEVYLLLQFLDIDKKQTLQCKTNSFFDPILL